MVNLLTPNDVRHVEFTPRRLRTGYDMDEVDLFLDDVETTIRALTNWVPARVPRRKPQHRYIYKGAKK